MPDAAKNSKKKRKAPKAPKDSKEKKTEPKAAPHKVSSSNAETANQGSTSKDPSSKTELPLAAESEDVMHLKDSAETPKDTTPPRAANESSSSKDAFSESMKNEANSKETTLTRQPNSNVPPANGTKDDERSVSQDGTSTELEDETTNSKEDMYPITELKQELTSEDRSSGLKDSHPVTKTESEPEDLLKKQKLMQSQASEEPDTDCAQNAAPSKAAENAREEVNSTTLETPELYTDPEPKPSPTTATKMKRRDSKVTFVDIEEQKVVFLFGQIEDGKSSLGNVLLGYEHNTGPLSGHTNTKPILQIEEGNFQGKESQPIKVIEIPGNIDKSNKSKVIKSLKAEAIAHIFLWVRNGERHRIDQIEHEYLKILEDIFGKEAFREHLVISFSQWGHNKNDTRRRELQGRTFESLKQDFERLLASVDKKYSESYIQMFAVDALYDAQFEEENTAFQKELDMLWGAIRRSYGVKPKGGGAVEGKKSTSTTPSKKDTPLKEFPSIAVRRASLGDKTSKEPKHGSGGSFLKESINTLTSRNKAKFSPNLAEQRGKNARKMSSSEALKTP